MSVAICYHAVSPARSVFPDFVPDPDFFPKKSGKSLFFVPKVCIFIKWLYIIPFWNPLDQGSAIEIFSRCFRSIRMNKKVKCV